jgi:glycerate dehydrogenase
MKIVVLDGKTLNPGDLSWSGVERHAETFEVYDRSNRAETIERAKGATVLFSNKTVLDREILEQLPDLKYIGVLATGMNVIDLEAAAEQGIVVKNVPAYGTEAVAQMAFALLLGLCRRVEHHAYQVRQGKWADSPDFCFWDYPQVDILGATLGIVGYGDIGQAVARIAKAFGMNVLVMTRRPEALPSNITAVTFEELLRQSDIVSLHCPLTPQTQHLIGEKELVMMKPSAFLINTSRGPLIDENALAQALESGAIAGAGLDVLSVEPPTDSHPLYAQENCLITPHIAWATAQARTRLMEVTVQNLNEWVASKT